MNTDAADAISRATLLLLEHLTDEQRVQLVECNYIDVVDREGYLARIHNVRHGFVEARGQAWCSFPSTYNPYSMGQEVPPADETLTKKMVLEGNPWYFFGTANALYPPLFAQ